jgi:hypothetical protein
MVCFYLLYIFFTAKTPPQITTPFLPEYFVTEKSSEAKTFQCSATGYPTPK